MVVGCEIKFACIALSYGKLIDCNHQRLIDFIINTVIVVCLRETSSELSLVTRSFGKGACPS